MLFALLMVFSSGFEAAAGGVSERVRAHGVVRCGGVSRPGLADRDGHGAWRGLEVDVCRAVADAVLGSPERIEFHAYQAPSDFDAVRNRTDDLYFFTGSEIAQEGLAGQVLPGPTVFVESHAVMVPAGSAARHLADLATEGICFEIGTPVERSLEAYFDGMGRGWLRRAFSEEGEMADMYGAQDCRALAGELTALAELRLRPGVSRLASRMLPESTADFPILAATSTEDGRWSAIVAWTVHTLVSAERPETRWYAGGAGAMPAEAGELGLGKGWQGRVVKDVGSYGAIFERNLGKGSPLKLERGLNANRLQGGMLLSPFLE